MKLPITPFLCTSVEEQGVTEKSIRKALGYAVKSTAERNRAVVTRFHRKLVQQRTFPVIRKYYFEQFQAAYVVQKN